MDLNLMALKLHHLEVSDWTVVVAGISIVLGTLMVLILVFYAFGAIVSKAGKRKSKKTDEKKNVLPPPAPIIPISKPTPQRSNNGVTPEVVAAISAAVYEMEGAGSVVTSITPIRRKNIAQSRNPWADAAVADNTRPF